MKKVLIYLNEGNLNPVGGENGYHYNLREGLLTIAHNNLDISYLPGVSLGATIDKRVHQIDRFKRLSSWMMRMKKYLGCAKTQFWFRHNALVDLERYDAVYFQSTYSMYKTRNSLKTYKGKVILQSHTPTKPGKEAYDNLSEYGKYSIKWASKIFDRADKYAFDRADYIVFPCEEAEEPYYNQWEEYAEIKERNKEKYHYLLTGTMQKHAVISRENIRNKYGIPKDAFVISYVGRHNRVKGYDLLKEMGRILCKQENVYFLIAGAETPIQGLEDKHWIEVGWTNDPHSLIAASDVFVLPNRETYFDLVMLEVLSLGQIIVASNTGGNRYFQKYRDSGVFLYDDVSEAVKLINKVRQMSEKKRELLRDACKKIYMNCFSNSVFANHFIELLEELL